MSKKFDFSGYATKVDLKCSDGRVIKKDAFKHNSGQTVPLVWQHLHSEPVNVLGHALLENREDGVYAYCKFNDTESGKTAKTLVEHGDITALSIHANQLKQKGNDVLHGVIREVSLVLSGANPGALIDNLSIQHGDGSFTQDDTEAIIYTDSNISLTDLEHADKNQNGSDSKTMKDVFETFSEEQKTVVYAMLAHAIEGEEEDEMKQSGDGEEDEKINHSDEGGKVMKKNVFDSKGEEEKKSTTLTHAQFQTILGDAQKCGSLKEAILSHAVDYGIENIDILFPDAQTLSKDPEWLKRETDWVNGVLSAISKSPFSRVKSVIADMDIDTARAKGYVKATEKKEVYFKAAKRVTTPTTIYVKQKLDRDDIIDVVDFDIVSMVRMQLRTLLDEELAVAALIGDGRPVEDPYKINEENIRPIWTDEDLYSIKEVLTTKTDYAAMIEEIAMSGNNYKGSGAPVLYTTNYHHVRMLWVKDTTGRRIYETDAMLTAALGVSKIVEIPALEAKTRTLDDNSVRELIAIKVNLKDYNFGADKGGQIASFDDFDIDFNQYKYLMETRCSGALTKPKSAQIYEFEVPQG
jgi:HK97 family phage prohead protease